MYEGKVSKALEINKLLALNEKDKACKVLNKCSTDYISSSTLKLLLIKRGKN